MANLILLEGEPVLRREVGQYLRECGHDVDETGSLAEFDAQYRPGYHRIALLDLGLPDGDGYGVSLIVRLRARGESVGIIVLTARRASREKIEGLLAGADHCFCRPLELAELSASIAALARRLDTTDVRPHWVLDTLRCQLIPPGKAPIPLTAHSYIVLNIIVQGEGQPVDRRKIVEALGENFLQYDLRRLDTQIYQLRKTVESQSGVNLPMQSARGRGYQITERFALVS